MGSKSLVAAQDHKAITPDTSPSLFSRQRPAAPEDDYIVVERPDLRITTLADYERLLQLVDPKTKDVDAGFRLHPLAGKIVCPRCGASMLLRRQQEKYLCNHSHRKEGYAGELCSMVPIDFTKVERSLFSALEQLSSGREDGFAESARARYEQAVAALTLERRATEENVEFHRGRIKDLVKTSTQNHHVRASLDELVEDHSRQLDEALERLHRMRPYPEVGDPKQSLLDIHNMLAFAMNSSPFPFARTDEGLAFRNKLRKSLQSLNLIELGNERYDLDYVFDVGVLLDMGGKRYEVVRVADRDLQGGMLAARRRQMALDEYAARADYKLTTKQWGARPDLPVLTSKFGADARKVVSSLIVMADCRVGPYKAMQMVGLDVPIDRVARYKVNTETELLRAWLQAIRPREHAYECFGPKKGRPSPTLTERLARIGHALCTLDRCDAALPLKSLSENEWAELLPMLRIRRRDHDSNRERIDDLIKIVRGNLGFGATSKSSFPQWLHGAEKHGQLLVIVNYFLRQEGKPEVRGLPKLPPVGRAD